MIKLTAETLDIFVESNRPMLLAIARKKMLVSAREHHQFDAEDLLQEACLRVHKAYVVGENEIRENGDMEKILTTIFAKTINRALIDTYRRSKGKLEHKMTRNSYAEAAGIPSKAMGPVDECNIPDSTAFVKEIVAKYLPWQEGLTFLAAILDGKPRKAAAADSGKTENEISGQLRRARKILRANLKENEHGELERVR
jgi:RNA polymerase sigma factor (sigma-70 family)